MSAAEDTTTYLGSLPACGVLRRTAPRKPCGMAAGWGTDHVGEGPCKLHGGALPGVRAKSLRILTERRVDFELGLLLEELELDATQVDRLEVLSEQVDRAYAMVTVLGMLVGQLPMDGLATANVKGDDEAHVLTRMYADWVDRAGRLAKLAKDAGLEERRVEVVEREATELVRVIRHVLDGLKLTQAQREQAGQLVREAIGPGPTAGTQDALSRDPEPVHEVAGIEVPPVPVPLTFGEFAE